MPNYNLVKAGITDLSRRLDDMTPFEAADAFDALKKCALAEASAQEKLDMFVSPTESETVFENDDKTETVLYKDDKVTLFLTEYKYNKASQEKLSPSLAIKIGSTIMDASKLDKAIKTLLPFDLEPYLERLAIAEDRYYEIRPALFNASRSSDLQSAVDSLESNKSSSPKLG